MASRKKWHALVVVASLAFAGTAGTAGARAPAAAPSLGTLTAGGSLQVTGQGFTPHAAVVVTQCSTRALAAALTAVTVALDDCDEHFVAVTSSGAGGSFAVRARALPTIQTAAGRVDCRAPGACLLGALNLDALQGRPLQVASWRSPSRRRLGSRPPPNPRDVCCRKPMARSR